MVGGFFGLFVEFEVGGGEDVVEFGVFLFVWVVEVIEVEVVCGVGVVG